MKNLFVFYLSMLAFLCFSCNRNQTNQEGDDPCCRGIASSIYINGDGIKTEFVDGVFRLDFKIESDEEGEVFIMLALSQPDDYVSPIRGYGNDVKVDGFTIRSYHQLPVSQLCEFGELVDSPILEFPVFVKKIMVPNGSIHERINVRLPDGVTECWGQIALFRNSKAIEESMNTKVSPEAYWDKAYKGTINGFSNNAPRDFEHFDHYYKLFPDSSMFSYLITSGSDLWYDYCDNDLGFSEGKECSPPRVGFSIGASISKYWGSPVFFTVGTIPHYRNNLKNNPYTSCFKEESL